MLTYMFRFLGYRDCAIRMQSGGGGGKDPEEVIIVKIYNLLLQNSLSFSLPWVEVNPASHQVRRNAMNNPEVQQIMGDPAMRMILEQMQTDPQVMRGIITYFLFFNVALANEEAIGGIPGEKKNINFISFNPTKHPDWGC